MKTCKVCNENKNFIYFGKDKNMSDGHLNQCKSCRNLLGKKSRAENKEHFNKVRGAYIERNKERIINNVKEFYKNNKETQAIRRKAYYEKNREIILVKQREYSKNRRKTRKSNLNRNKEERNRKERVRRKTDLLYAIKCQVHGMTTKAFYRNGYIKNGKSAELLGCDYVDLVNYIERKFKKGMRWSNRKDWHIDHIIPLSSAKTEEDVRVLCHYTNLQPLWAKDNLEKSNKIPRVQMVIPI